MLLFVKIVQSAIDSQQLKPYIRTMKKRGLSHLSRTIRRLMADVDIDSYKKLADRLNSLALQEGLVSENEQFITPGSVRKWFLPEKRGGSEPRGTSLMLLAKALRVSADLILFEDGDNLDKTKELTKMVTAIVQAETKKILSEGKVGVENTLALVLKSDKIPPEDKEALIRQARNLLRLYKEIE